MASKLSLFLVELKRRRVYRVAALYAGIGVAIALGGAELYEVLLLPDWTARLVIVLLVLGFPVALLLAWAYEVKPEEPRPQEAAREGASPSPGIILSDDPRPSVAVLPFANLSADPENEYFSDGITFDIINHLAKIADLKVISRTSVMRFKATDTPLRQIGRELGVASIVEGEVQRVEDRVRISAQLVDARTDEHLWAEQYDREVLDVFAIQGEVATQVAAALKTTLTSDEKERIDRRPTDNLEAYTLYLKGRHFWDMRGEGLKRGLEYFQRALEIDPDFAPAHAGVSDCYSLLGFYGFLPVWEAMPQAIAAALRALEIDETLAEAHSSLGWAKLCTEWDLLAAEEDFKRAIRCNPGYAPAHYWYAAGLLSKERFKEAVTQNEQAVEVDPLSVIVHAQFGWVLIGQRDFERSREQLMKALEFDPDSMLAHWLLGWCYGVEGRLEDSIRHLEKACEGAKGPTWPLAMLGWAYGASGREDEARRVLAEFEKARSKQFIRSLYLSYVCIGLGMKTEALDWLDQAYEERDLWMLYLGVDGIFDSLRTESRFVELLGRVGSEAS